MARTRTLLHLVDVEPMDGSNPVHNVQVIQAELARFSPALAELPVVLVLNKLDQVLEEEHDALCDQIVTKLGWTGPVFRTSGLTGEGTRQVLYYLMDQIEQEQEREAEDPDFAIAQRERRQRLEQETRENALALHEAQREARRAAREAGEWDDDDFDDFDDEDGPEVIYSR